MSDLTALQNQVVQLTQVLNTARANLTARRTELTQAQTALTNARTDLAAARTPEQTASATQTVRIATQEVTRLQQIVTTTEREVSRQEGAVATAERNLDSFLFARASMPDPKRVEAAAANISLDNVTRAATQSMEALPQIFQNLNSGSAAPSDLKAAIRTAVSTEQQRVNAVQDVVTTKASSTLRAANKQAGGPDTPAPMIPPTTTALAAAATTGAATTGTAEQATTERTPARLGDGRNDIRVRIRPRPAQAQWLYGSSSRTQSPEQTSSDDAAGGANSRSRRSPRQAQATQSIMSPLRTTQGVVFPYTPTIQWESVANYGPMEATHTNTTYHFYTNTPAVKFTLQGQFTAQTEDEARYMLAAMHFFRTVTKMDFGDNSDGNPGMPPPVLLLSGYGDYMLNDLPVVITNFSMEMPNNVDYVRVAVSGEETWVPSLSTFNVSCIVQHSAAKQRSFNLRAFANGSLVKRGGWI